MGTGQNSSGTKTCFQNQNKSTSPAPTRASQCESDELRHRFIGLAVFMGTIYFHVVSAFLNSGPEPQPNCMIATLSLFGIEKAPLNSDIGLVGLHSLLGIGRAKLVAYPFNVRCSLFVLFGRIRRFRQLLLTLIRWGLPQSTRLRLLDYFSELPVQEGLLFRS